MQQSGIFSNEKLHEYRYSVPVCYNHGGKKCQKYAKITAKILIIYVMIITWIPTPVRNVPAWYALLPKTMTNGKATGKFLILSPNRRKAISLPVNNYCIRQESCSNEWFIGGPVCIMKNCLLHVSVPALAFLLPDAALKPYWNNSHPPETHPSGNLLLHLTPQLKPKQKTVSIWMNFPVPCKIFQEASLF